MSKARRIWMAPLPKMPPESELEVLEIGRDLEHYLSLGHIEANNRKVQAAKARHEAYIREHMTEAEIKDGYDDRDWR